MIIGNINEALSTQGVYSPVIIKLLEYCKDTDFSQLPDGRHPVPGTELTAQLHRYQTKPHSETRPESHKNNVDFLYIVAGDEYLGWCAFTPGLVPDGGYDAERDNQFYKALTPDNDLALRAGCFVVLTPKDIHAPYRAIGDTPSPVTKVIVKIPTTMFK